MIRGKKRAGKHRGKGQKENERENGTTCNANLSINKKAKC
jgi:hypothetical protein